MQHTSLVILDRKLDYIHLAKRLGKACQLVSVHDPQTRIGLNAPEGVPPNVWINHIATLLAARAGMVAAWTPLAAMLKWLLSVMNLNPGPCLRWPSLGLLLEVAKSGRPTEWASKDNYLGTLIGSLDAMTQTTPLFDCFGGVDADSIVRNHQHLILAMPNMNPPWIRRFVTDLIISQLLVSRIQRHEKVDRTAVILVVGESDQDLTVEADAQYSDAMPPLCQTLRMGREYGIMPIIELAKLHSVSQFVLCEPVYHAIFNQSDARSIMEVCRTLQLPDGAASMLPALPPGQCLFREAQGPWPHVMRVQVNFTAPGRGPVGAYDVPASIPSQHLWEMPEIQQALRQRNAQANAMYLQQSKGSQAEEPKNLLPAAHALLHAAAVHPWMPVARLWEKTGQAPPPAAQLMARKELESRKLADFEEVRIGKTNVLLMCLTDAGWKSVGRASPNHVGRGGIAHRHFARLLQAVGKRKGFTSELEWLVPNTSHPVDCAWEIAKGVWQVFEIVVTCEGNLAESVLACCAKDSPVQLLVIVFTQKVIRDRVEKELQSDIRLAPFLNMVQFHTIDAYQST